MPRVVAGIDLIRLGFVVVLALMLMAVGCSADPASPAGEDSGLASAEQESEGTGIELSDDAFDAVGECAASGDDDSVPCLGLVSGAPLVGRVGITERARAAVADWADANGAVVSELTTDGGKADYLDSVDLLVERGYEVIIVMGAESGSVLSTAAESNPDVLFVGVDQLDPEELPNLALVAFSEHEVGFLAGALAGLLTNSGDVAHVLGSALVPPVSDLRQGFVNGVAFTNSRADSDSFFHPGDLDVAFSDPVWGAAAAGQALDAGADVVFGTGGSTGHGALVETAERDGEAFCIGVDSDKWAVVPEAQPCLVTSIVKMVEPVIAEILDAAVEGKSPSGEFMGGVGYSDYHDFANQVPGEVQQAAEIVATQLQSGEIAADRQR